MPEITQKEFNEYQTLKNHYGWNAVEQSLASVDKLEDDIDKPIKWTVAAFTLLGLQSVFSCCGFNYIGQPLHKSHTIGNTYFLFYPNERCEFVSKTLDKHKNYLRGWNWGTSNGSGLYKEDVRYTIWYNETWARNNCPEWNDPNCVHFSELAAIAISILNNVLWNYTDQMHSSAILSDSNSFYQKSISGWQYTGKKPWKITKLWLLENFPESGKHAFADELPAHFQKVG